MKSAFKWIAILLLCSTCISIAVCEELKAGKATVDLGDGYKASFVLPDIGKSYQVEGLYKEGTSGEMVLGMYKPYGIMISSDGNDPVHLQMSVYTSPQFLFLPEAGIQKSPVPDEIGPRITTPRTISGAQGYTGYDLKPGATGTDTSDAMGGFFKFYPNAYLDSGDLKGLIEVYVETGDSPASPQALQVLESMLDSIKISGPGI